MTSFLFWNTNKNEPFEIIGNLCNFYEIDVLILAECISRPSKMLKYLNKNGPIYYYTRSFCEKIDIYARFPEGFIKPIYEEDRLTARNLTLPGKEDITIIASHFIDKFSWDDDSQNAECSILSQTIIDIEKKVGHRKTVLIGDLNMNPFQAGMINANGLHAVMDKRVALKKDRKVQGREYHFFYNPMWNKFGDESGGPPGTYYSWKAVHKTYFWNILDQVLIRPEAIQYFNDSSLKIVDNDGINTLLNSNGTPKKNYSDHLPIKFTLVH